MEDRTTRIRDIAYSIWEEEGRPHGKDREHWERARQIVEMEDAERAGYLSGEKEPPAAEKSGDK